MSFQAEAPPLMSFSASWIIYVKLIRLLTPFFSLHDFYWHMCSVFGNDRNFAETCAWPSPPSRATKRTSRITSIWCKQQFWLLLACRTQHEWRSLSGKVWKKIIHTHARTHSHAHAHIYWRSNHARPLFSPLDIHVVLTHTHNMNVKLGTFVVVILLMFALSANADTQLWFFWTRFLRSAHTHTHTMKKYQAGKFFVVCYFCLFASSFICVCDCRHAALLILLDAIYELLNRNVNAKTRSLFSTSMCSQMIQTLLTTWVLTRSESPELWYASCIRACACENVCICDESVLKQCVGMCSQMIQTLLTTWVLTRSESPELWYASCIRACACENVYICDESALKQCVGMRSQMIQSLFPTWVLSCGMIQYCFICFFCVRVWTCRSSHLFACCFMLLQGVRACACNVCSLVFLPLFFFIHRDALGERLALLTEWKDVVSVWKVIS